MFHPPGNFDLPPLNYRNPNNSSYNVNNNRSVYNTNSMLATPMGRVNTSPPPVPARPNRSVYNPGYNTFSSQFSSYGNYYPSYGGYGNYGGFGFGGYRPGFNSFGYGAGPESRFIQLAEERSRPAFESIQSVLQVFSSMTMMFESSFHAIYSSYMSVLGVADNFAKLRTVFGQIFSTFALFKSLRWLCRRILSMLGMSKGDFNTEALWSEALNAMSDVNSENASHGKRTWPTLLFLSIVIGGPYLLFKLMSELYPSSVQVWVPSERPGSLAVGLYDFQAASDQELSFRPEQKLIIAPKEFQPSDCPGWLLACNESEKTGLVPSNYIGMIMQSEKTGKTFLEHNGHTYLHPSVRSHSAGNPVEDNHNTSNDRGFQCGEDVKESNKKES